MPFKKGILLISFLFLFNPEILFAQTIYRDSDIVETNNDLPAAEYNSSAKSATNYPNITKLENKLFHQNFAAENIYSRLNRLEKKIFGANFLNDSLSARVDRLKTAISTETSDYSAENNASNLDSDTVAGSIYANVSDLELKLFGKSFNNELVSVRIERLEKKVFGAVQPGNTDARLSHLNNAVNNNFIPPESNQNNQVTGYNSSQSNNSTPVSLGGSGSQWDDEFFNNSPQMSGTGTGSGSMFWDFVQTLAVPIVMSFLNKGNSAQSTPQPGYYNYPQYYSGYPQNYINPQYSQPYPGYMPNNGYYPYSTQSSGQGQNNFGMGVHILP